MIACVSVRVSMRYPSRTRSSRNVVSARRRASSRSSTVRVIGSPKRRSSEACEEARSWSRSPLETRQRTAVAGLEGISRVSGQWTAGEGLAPRRLGRSTGRCPTIPDVCAASHVLRVPVVPTLTIRPRYTLPAEAPLSRGRCGQHPVAGERAPRASPRGHRGRASICRLASWHGVWNSTETPAPAERASRETTMFDVSDRFLHQLAADRRASLQPSRKAFPLRTALGALLARVGVAAGRDAARTESRRRPRPALTNPEEATCSPRDGSTGSTQASGNRSSARVRA